MEAARHLSPVPDPTNHKELGKRVSKGTSLVIDKDTGQADIEATDLIAGLYKTIDWQGRRIGSLERQAEEDGRLESHPRGAEIMALWERYLRASGKTKAKFGAPRKKLVLARIRDGFPISAPDDSPQPSLELALDGLCAYPYRVFDRRERTGKRSNLDNDFDAAMKDERHVEALSRLGWKAREQGLVTWEKEAPSAK